MNEAKTIAKKDDKTNHLDEMIKNRSNATSNETDSAESDQEPDHATTKQNKFLQAFGNIFNEMKGNSILQQAVCNMHRFRCSSSVKNEMESILNS